MRATEYVMTNVSSRIIYKGWQFTGRHHEEIFVGDETLYIINWMFFKWVYTFSELIKFYT